MARVEEQMSEVFDNISESSSPKNNDEETGAVRQRAKRRRRKSPVVNDAVSSAPDLSSVFDTILDLTCNLVDGSEATETEKKFFSTSLNSYVQSKSDVAEKVSTYLPIAVAGIIFASAVYVRWRNKRLRENEERTRSSADIRENGEREKYIGEESFSDTIKKV